MRLSIKGKIITACSNCWGIVLFAILCFMLFEQGIKNREHDYLKLSQRLAELHQDKEKALTLRENLLLQINSQSDPAWVELILMKELGLVPENHLKVFFTRQE